MTMATSLPMLWANCVERLKDRINNRSFWEALEQTRPITIENDTLIIGMELTNFNLVSSIQQSAHLNATLNVIKDVFGQPLQMRIIEGATLADWETVKANDSRVAAVKQAASTRQVGEAKQTTGWEGLLESLTRLYNDAPLRSLPQGKARYANEALYLICESMDALYTSNPDEQAERTLARVLDRVASSSEIPAPVLAFELERLCAWRKPETDGNG